MNFWEIFWMVNIILALVSFTIISVYVLIKGYGEVKEMLSSLESRNSDDVKEAE